jgi:hypothetical protein
MSVRVRVVLSGGQAGSGSAPVRENPTRARRNGLFSGLLGGKSAKEQEYRYAFHHKTDESKSIYVSNNFISAVNRAAAMKEAKRKLRNALDNGGAPGETKTSAYKIVMWKWKG